MYTCSRGKFGTISRRKKKKRFARLTQNVVLTKQDVLFREHQFCDGTNLDRPKDRTWCNIEDVTKAGPVPPEWSKVRKENHYWGRDLIQTVGEEIGLRQDCGTLTIYHVCVHVRTKIKHVSVRVSVCNE